MILIIYDDDFFFLKKKKTFFFLTQARPHRARKLRVRQAVPDRARNVRRRHGVAPLEHVDARRDGSAVRRRGVAHAVRSERVRKPRVDVPCSRERHRRRRGARRAIPVGVDGLRVGHRRARRAVAAADGRARDARLRDRRRRRRRRLGQVREVAGRRRRQRRGGARSGDGVGGCRCLLEREAGEAVGGFCFLKGEEKREHVRKKEREKERRNNADVSASREGSSSSVLVDEEKNNKNSDSVRALYFQSPKTHLTMQRGSMCSRLAF